MSGSHTVVAGETLGAIAKKYGIPVADLATWNKLDNPNLIKVGQKLVLADPDAPVLDGEKYKVAAGDTFSEIGQKFGVDYKEIMKVNGYEDPTKLLAGSTITIPYRTYKVAAGDTFSAIGQKFGVPYEKIMKHNGYEDPTKLLAGSTITIPFA